MKQWWRKLLWPLVPFYYIGALFIKKMYDWNLFQSTTSRIPLICVGNISAGGTGKTPFVNYLNEYFQQNYTTAIISRGYGRSSKGFHWVNLQSTSDKVGDEPLQHKLNMPQTLVAVDTERRNALHILETSENCPEIAILDDAFQHRKVKAHINILLTTYHNLYTLDYPLPAGDLREPRSAAQRANIVIVTKCPEHLSETKQEQIASKLKLSENQQLFFTKITYANYVFSSKEKRSLNTFIQQDFTLVTGIANPKPLVNFINKQTTNYKHLIFKDHHNFSIKDIDKIAKSKVILTTEKDFMRLKNEEKLRGKLFYLPIAITFLKNEELFQKHIRVSIEKIVHP